MEQFLQRLFVVFALIMLVIVVAVKLGFFVGSEIKAHYINSIENAVNEAQTHDK